ncbi:MAG: YbfB/YjiJ family MFS transporter, partial [Janthinobacterium sp.]
MPIHDQSPAHPLATALALSLGAAIALGLSRFSYGLLLPPMRADLGWSYLLAGAMNTFNALGYFLGALATPALMRRLGVWRLLIIGCVLASVFMLMSGLVSDTAALREVAEGYGLGFDAVNSNTFQDQLGQAHTYKHGSLTSQSAAVRAQAVEHNIECIELGRALGSKALTVWVGDGA